MPRLLKGNLRPEGIQAIFADLLTDILVNVLNIPQGEKRGEALASEFKSPEIASQIAETFATMERTVRKSRSKVARLQRQIRKQRMKQAKAGKRKAKQQKIQRKISAMIAACQEGTGKMAFCVS